MSDRILIFYGSYRSDRQGIRLADWLVRAFAECGATAELIDAKSLDPRRSALQECQRAFAGQEWPHAPEGA